MGHLNICLIGLFVIFILACGCTTQSSGSSSVGSDSIDKTVAGTTKEYEIIESEDISIKALDQSLSSYSSSELTNLPMNTRMTYRVIVPTNISKKELEATFIKIVEDELELNPEIDEITIWAYDRLEDISGPYTFGMCQWCPNGDWGGVTSEIALNNDRSTYEFVFDIKEKVGNTERYDIPTQREFEIYDAYEEALWNDPDMNEDKIDTEISKKYGITVEELNKIYYKVVYYKLS